MKTTSAHGVLRRVGIPVVTGLLVTLLVGSMSLFLVEVQEGRHIAQVRSELVREGSRVRAGLERSVEAQVARTEGLVGFATAEATDGEVDEELFQTFARQLDEDRATPFRRLQLAPDGVVAHVYPPADAATAVGDEPLADPRRRAAVEAAIAARRTLVSGPIEVPDVGVVLYARAPVFVPTADGGDRWWGLATTIAEVEPVYEQAGLRSVPEDVSVALRGRDGSGAGGEVFFGEEAVFADDPVTFDVALPSGTWQLALQPAGGWEAVSWPDRLPALGGGLLLAAVLGVMVWAVMSSRAAARAALVDRTELIEAANSPIVQVTADGRVTVWNSRATQLSGIATRDIVGTNVRERLDADQTGPARDLAVAVARLLLETIETGEGIEGRQIVVEQPHGRPRSLVFNTTPLVGDRGRITDMVAIAQDVTARQEAERIQRENESMAEAARLKDEFLANTSHELRTPLNGIIGLTSVIAGGAAGPVTPQQAEYLRHVEVAGSKLLSRINDILELARASVRGASDPPLAEVDVAAAVLAAVGQVTPSAEGKGLPIDVEVADDARIVLGDHARLVEVLTHLLSNAVKFTPSGHVAVRARRDRAEVRIDVVDTGIGIPHDKRHLLFRPFTQLDASLDRAYDGSGLGLALAQRLVTALGGRIEVTSDPGSGSRFTVVLAAGAAGHGPTDNGPARRSRPRVLVVEDQAQVRVSLAEALSAAGYDVHTAVDGLDAVELARRVHPAVALVGLAMARREGLRVASALKSHRETWDTLVIAMVADEQSSDWQDVGCDAFVPVPGDLAAAGAVVGVLDALLDEPDVAPGLVPSPPRPPDVAPVG